LSLDTLNLFYTQYHLVTHISATHFWCFSPSLLSELYSGSDSESLSSAISCRSFFIFCFWAPKKLFISQCSTISKNENFGLPISFIISSPGNFSSPAAVPHSFIAASARTAVNIIQCSKCFQIHRSCCPYQLQESRSFQSSSVLAIRSRMTNLIPFPNLFWLVLSLCSSDFRFITFSIRNYMGTICHLLYEICIEEKLQGTCQCIFGYSRSLYFFEDCSTSSTPPCKMSPSL